MVGPQRAAVVPRVLSEISGDPFPIEEVLAPYLGQAGAIALLGPFGAGKTTALAHVATVFPGRLAVLDEDAEATEVDDASQKGLALYARDRVHRMRHLATLCLAPWGRDEALEYLMAVHRAACGEVMGRLAAADLPMLGGLPELWCAVLDRMAAGATGVAAALAEVATRTAIGDRIYRHPVVVVLRRAYGIALDIRAGPGDWPALGVRQEPEVIRGAARLLAGATEARDALAALCDAKPDERQPMAASLLVALDPEWKPRGVPRLEGAYLGGARWRAAELREADLRYADLARADLDAAVFDRANASNASFREARLRGASFLGARLLCADLGGADFAGATLVKANLLDADLRRASLPGADLAEANLVDAQVEGADLSGANLSGAHCRGLDLRTVRLEGANFSAAHLEHCHLDGVRLRGARFDHAQMEEAFLTASVMPKACFRDAVLRDARVAEIDWEGADLRGADLTGAIFHMGSSRGGLVDSVIASEGSRTGFYTDEYDEQHFKAPEEIRKANLRGADLRGANVLGADFYLVDLREALYDDAQEAHFRSCRAILRAKGA